MSEPTQYSYQPGLLEVDPTQNATKVRRIFNLSNIALFLVYFSIGLGLAFLSRSAEVFQMGYWLAQPIAWIFLAISYQGSDNPKHVIAVGLALLASTICGHWDAALGQITIIWVFQKPLIITALFALLMAMGGLLIIFKGR